MNFKSLIPTGIFVLALSTLGALTSHAYAQGVTLGGSTMASIDYEQFAIDSIEELYLDLFGQSKSYDEIYYFTNTQVSGVGSWNGFNEALQPYSLVVEHHVPFDLTELAVDEPEAYANLMAAQVHGATVVGEIYTANATLPVVGEAISMDHPSLGVIHIFLPEGDPDDFDLLAGSDGTPPETAESTLPPLIEEYKLTVSYQKFDATPECLECKSDFENELENQANKLMQRIDKAKENYAIASGLAHTAYATAMAASQRAFYVQIGLCNLIPWPGAGICMLNAVVSRSARKALATGIYRAALKLAKNFRDGAINTAHELHDQAVAIAKMTYDDCLEMNDCWLDCTAELCVGFGWEFNIEGQLMGFAWGISYNEICE